VRDLPTTKPMSKLAGGNPPALKLVSSSTRLTPRDFVKTSIGVSGFPFVSSRTLENSDAQQQVHSGQKVSRRER
jgi:hypothetical protein